MDLIIPDTPQGSHLLSRFRRLQVKLGDTVDDATLERLIKLAEEAVTLLERQGPEKVVLRAGTPGRNRMVVEIPLAEILGL